MYYGNETNTKLGFISYKSKNICHADLIRFEYGIYQPTVFMINYHSYSNKYYFPEFVYPLNLIYLYRC